VIGLNELIFFRKLRPATARVKYFLTAAIAVLAVACPVAAQSPETNLFIRASEEFKAGLYPQAELSFSNFVATYTNSPLFPQAALDWARARIGRTNYTGAIDLLNSQLPAAGSLGDHYVFWIAEAHFQRAAPSDYDATIAGCSNLLVGFPSSGLRLQAAYFQALAHYKEGNIARAVDLLSAPDSAFIAATRNDPAGEFAASGWLLLSECYLAEKRYEEGEKILAGLKPSTLTAEFKWRRQYLLCRFELAGGQANLALADSTNLAQYAFGDLRQIDTTFLRAEILESLNKISDAIQMCTNNLEKRFPAEVQRKALAKAVDLMRAENQPQDALAQLQDFIASRAGSPALDAAYALLGDLYLKTYAVNTNSARQTNAAPGGGTNFFQAAATNLDRVIRDFPDSRFIGVARLDRGWCDWCQGRIAESKTNFLEAANRLTSSPEQAEALFKLADAQFELKDYGSAKTNYNLLLQQYAAVPSVTNELFDEALYQMVQACVRMGDNEGAALAADKLLTWFPNSYFGERGLLLIGEDQNRKYNYAAARATFNELLDRFPKTALMSRLRFAIARTFDYEGNAKAALDQYTQWTTNFPNDPLLPQVEFDRALAMENAGMETNAFNSFTNFVARFPSNSLTPLARNWIADYYWNNQDLVQAELHYQQLYQDPQAGKLAFQGRMMAGRVDFALQDYPAARTEFVALINDPATPPKMYTEGLFALGDTYVEIFHAYPTNTDFLDQAIQTFTKITNATASNSLAILAYGKLGDCYRQWADFKTNAGAYVNAAQMYQAALNLYDATAKTAQAGPSGSPATNAPVVEIADVANRNQAEAGLGLVAERQQLPDLALNYYSRVLFERDSDPFWVEQTGVAAARLCEERSQWDQAVRIYERVLQAVPSLRPTLVNKIAADNSRAEASKN
jgi:TolA-binding protein